MRTHLLADVVYAEFIDHFILLNLSMYTNNSIQKPHDLYLSVYMISFDLIFIVNLVVMI